MAEVTHFDSGAVAPEIVPRQLPKIFEGHPYKCCTVDDFVTQMHSGSATGYCQKVEEAGRLKVFWYPAAAAKNINPRRKPSIQERIKSFLLSIATVLGDGVLVQFWAPIVRSNTKQIMLSAAEQPFGLDQLYNGLCRFRYRCIEYEYPVVGVDDNTSEPVGPIGRAFTRGYSESVPLDSYSIEEFPLTDYALESCDIKEYVVLPLFERDDICQQRCIGVLEFLAPKISGIDSFRSCYFMKTALEKALKERNFVMGNRKFHSTECKENHPAYYDDTALLEIDEVREDHELPLVQLWLPCMCFLPHSNVSNSQSNTIKLCSDIPHIYEISPDWRNTGFENSYVENGKSWVERAYSQKKMCFFKHTDQFSIWDYPYIPWTRSWGLAPCIAIPLPLIHPELPPSILEVFLPPEKQYSIKDHQEVILLLEKLLATFEYAFSRCEDIYIIQKPQQETKFHVYFSHLEDGFVFFDVYRNGQKASWRNIGEENEKNEATSRSVHPNAQDTAAKSSRQQIDIPLLGQKRKEAARELGASKSTRKDISGHFDTANWRKERKEHQIQPNLGLLSGCVQHGVVQSNPRFSSESSEQESNETVREPEIKPFQNNNARDGDTAALNPTQTIAKGKSTAMGSGNKIDDGSFTMNIVATYGGDNIKIEFSSSSGIEELRRELDECFELEGKKFKIKYEQNGRWILIPRDKDLHKYMDILKAKGVDTMNVSIFPAT